MGQQCLVAAGAVISARGVERRKLVECCRSVDVPAPIEIARGILAGSKFEAASLKVCMRSNRLAQPRRFPPVNMGEWESLAT